MPGITWGDALHNWAFAFLGNLVGAVVFVAGFYWYLYAREPKAKPPVEGLAAGNGAPDREAARAPGSTLTPRA